MHKKHKKKHQIHKHKNYSSEGNSSLSMNKTSSNQTNNVNGTQTKYLKGNNSKEDEYVSDEDISIKIKRINHKIITPSSIRFCIMVF